MNVSIVLYLLHVSFEMLASCNDAVPVPNLSEKLLQHWDLYHHDVCSNKWKHVFSFLLGLHGHKGQISKKECVHLKNAVKTQIPGWSAVTDMFGYGFLSAPAIYLITHYEFQCNCSYNGSALIDMLSDSLMRVKWLFDWGSQCRTTRKKHQSWLWDSIYDSNQITFYFYAVVVQQKCTMLSVNDGLDNKLGGLLFGFLV